MNNDVTSVIRNVRAQRSVNIAKSLGATIEGTADAFFKSDHGQEIVKGLSSDNPFERENAKMMLQNSDLSDIQKSDIYEAINYSETFRFSKSGKELKEQIKNVVLPQKMAELTTKKAEADNLLKICGDAPTQPCCPWWTCRLEIETGYKQYDWSETRMPCRDAHDVYDNFCTKPETKCNYPEDEEQAKARRDYNQAVEIICKIMVDIKTCEILVANIKDGDSYKLNASQIVCFKFN